MIALGQIPNTIANIPKGAILYTSLLVKSRGASTIYVDKPPKHTRLYKKSP